MQIRDLMIQAINLFQNNQLNDASIILDKILKKDSNNPDALRVYGDIFLVKREYLRAIEFYKKSLIYYPKQPLVFNNCGACFLNIKNFAQAEYYFDLALSEDPKNQEALFNKAYVCDLTNNLEKAIGFFQELIRVNPNFVDAYYKIISINLKLENYELAYKQLHDLFIKHPSAINGFFYQEKAFCAYKMGLLDEALKDVSIAIDKNPELAENYNNRGSIYNDLDKYDDALSDLNYAIKLKPDYSDAYMNIGLVNKKMKNFDKAFENFSIALNCDNKNYKVLINQAILNKEMHNYLAGLKIINELIDIHQSEAALSVRAEIFTSLKKYDLAIKDLTKAITLNPYKSDLYTNRGILYESIGEDSLALIDYRTISDREGNVSLLQKLSEAVLNLKNMNFEVGWKQYQVRKEMSKHSLAKINTSKPLWSGEKNLKRLYVSNEQGVGDQILFSSMLPEIMRRVKDIILSVDHRLKEVYERSFPNIEIIPTNSDDLKKNIRPNIIDESRYDFYIPMGDLGSIFRNHRHDFLNQPISFLKSDELKKKKFRSLIERQNKFICGISWKSAAAGGDVKSLKLSQLKKIFDIKTIDFVSLQYGDVSDEIFAFDKILHIESLDYFNQLDELFALVDACDFIITTSNVTAHIAGALGKETYLLRLFDSRLWYWHKADEYSLWYPHVKIINQKTPIFDSYELEQIIKGKYL